MSEPLVPDHVPTDWVAATAEFMLAETWKTLRNQRESANLGRIRYIIVPEQIYDMLKTQLDANDRWFCPEGYWVNVFVEDTWM